MMDRESSPLLTETARLRHIIHVGTPKLLLELHKSGLSFFDAKLENMIRVGEHVVCIDINGLRLMDANGHYKLMRVRDDPIMHNTIVQSYIQTHTTPSTDIEKKKAEEKHPELLDLLSRVHLNAWDGGTFYAPEELLAWFSPYSDRVVEMLATIFPEVPAGTTVDGRAADVYRLGAIYLQSYMLPAPRLSNDDALPFQNAGLNLLQDLIVCPKTLPKYLSENVPDIKMRDWIARMMHQNPLERPTIEEIVQEIK
jgi:serine/threonine protein kinase